MLITKEKTKAPPLYMPKPKTCQDKKAYARSYRHAFVGSDGKSKVQEVRRVREVGDHCRRQIELSQILR
jgi:hypothetical protein